MKTLQIGSKVQMPFFHDKEVLTVTDIDLWKSSGELSDENHGTVTLVKDNGDEVHSVYYGYERVMIIL